MWPWPPTNAATSTSARRGHPGAPARERRPPARQGTGTRAAEKRPSGPRGARQLRQHRPTLARPLPSTGTRAGQDVRFTLEAASLPPPGWQTRPGRGAARTRLDARTRAGPHLPLRLLALSARLPARVAGGLPAFRLPPVPVPVPVPALVPLALLLLGPLVLPLPLALPVAPVPVPVPVPVLPGPGFGPVSLGVFVPVAVALPGPLLVSLLLSRLAFFPRVVFLFSISARASLVFFRVSSVLKKKGWITTAPERVLAWTEARPPRSPAGAACGPPLSLGGPWAPRLSHSCCPAPEVSRSLRSFPSRRPSLRPTLSSPRHRWTACPDGRK